MFRVYFHIRSVYMQFYWNVAKISSRRRNLCSKYESKVCIKFCDRSGESSKLIDSHIYTDWISYKSNVCIRKKQKKNLANFWRNIKI